MQVSCSQCEANKLVIIKLIKLVWGCEGHDHLFGFSFYLHLTRFNLLLHFRSLKCYINLVSMTLWRLYEDLCEKPPHWTQRAKRQSDTGAATVSAPE